MITEKTRLALKIVQDNPGVRAAGFASLMWPDSDGHNAHKNGGNGSQKGKGMWLAGGSYLAKLRKKGLVQFGKTVWEYRITEAGIKELTQ